MSYIADIFLAKSRRGSALHSKKEEEQSAICQSMLKESEINN
jgi:hypothetical protein